MSIFIFYDAKLESQIDYCHTQNCNSAYPYEKIHFCV